MSRQWELPKWHGPAYVRVVTRLPQHLYVADDVGHVFRERDFAKWATDTVFPQAVNRRIRELCHD